MPERSSSVALEKASVAQWLEANREQIVSAWMSAVAADDRIPSADRLTMERLKDHFPEMLMELTGAIRQGSFD